MVKTVDASHCNQTLKDWCLYAQDMILNGMLIVLNGKPQRFHGFKLLLLRN